MAEDFAILDDYGISSVEKEIIIKAFETEGNESGGFKEYFAENYLKSDPIYPSVPKVSKMPVGFGAFQTGRLAEIESDESKSIWKILSARENSGYTGRFADDVKENEVLKDLLDRERLGDPIFIDEKMRKRPFEMTVFVPSNGAYRAGEKANVLYHIVMEKYSLSDFHEGDKELRQDSPTPLTTLFKGAVIISTAKQGDRVYVRRPDDLNSGIRDSARIINADIRAENGIIHIINNVLIPQSQRPKKDFEISEAFTDDLVSSKRKKKLIKSRYHEIKQSVPKVVHSKRSDELASTVPKVIRSKRPDELALASTVPKVIRSKRSDKISFTPTETRMPKIIRSKRASEGSRKKDPISFIDQISFGDNDPPLASNLDVVEFSTVRFGLGVLSKYFNVSDDAETLLKNKKDRLDMLEEAKGIIGKLSITQSDKGKSAISLDSNSHLGNEYSYFSPHKIKGMDKKELMRFAALTHALVSVPESPRIEAPVYKSSNARSLAKNIDSWIKEIIAEVKDDPIQDVAQMRRIIMTERSRGMADKLFNVIWEKGSGIEIAWVVAMVTDSMRIVIRDTTWQRSDEFLLAGWRETMNMILSNFGYTEDQLIQRRVQRFFGLFQSSEEKIIVGVKDFTAKIRKEKYTGTRKNLILKEADALVRALYTRFKFDPVSESKTSKEGTAKFILFGVMFGNLLVDMYFNKKLNDEARPDKNSQIRNSLWEDVVRDFIDNAKLMLEAPRQ